MGNIQSVKEEEEEDEMKVDLCPLLLIPDSTRLDCVVDTRLCRKRQDLSFSVRGVSGSDLFQVRAAESGDKPRVFLETLGGKEELASLSTKELWESAEQFPRLEIFHHTGTPFGSVQKIGLDYVVKDNSDELFRFAGDFQQRQYEAKSADDDHMATVTQLSQTTIKVVVFANNDAGLLMLCALAIEKCEVLPGDD